MAAVLPTDMPPSSGSLADGRMASPVEPGPSTPLEPPAHDLSQVTLPSTEIPPSPIEPTELFKTEVNEDRVVGTVIPSSLTPPPSTQVAAQTSQTRRGYSASQQSNFFSPPATILNTVRERDHGSSFVPPAPQQMLEASADELRTMLQASIAEQQKLKMETAHHKLQYNLLSLQADEDSKRAAVEHDMVRREVDALRETERSRQAKRELSSSSESAQVKYIQMKSLFEEAAGEVKLLQRRLKAAKRVIQEKDEETIGLIEERTMFLNRIRENREHFHMLISPGGMFHGAMTPKQQYASTPQQHRGASRSAAHAHGDTFSALLQAINQDNQSAPSTPHHVPRPVPRQMGRHNRNVQSMSSLPTTPINYPRGEHAGLLPSVDLVPQTEPPRRVFQTRRGPTTPVEKPLRGRQSRESTISAEDNEELARQALESVARPRRRESQPDRRPQRAEEDEGDVFDSQASRAATEMLWKSHHHDDSCIEVATSLPARGGTPAAAEQSARMQARLFSNSFKEAEKRKYNGQDSSDEDAARDRGSMSKKMKPLVDNARVGLGIR